MYSPAWDAEDTSSHAICNSGLKNDSDLLSQYFEPRLYVAHTCARHARRIIPVA